MPIEMEGKTSKTQLSQSLFVPNINPIWDEFVLAHHKFL